MGLFYKYMCKNCGKMYFQLPVICYDCHTELSFICPLDMWFPYNVKRRPTKDCEEIKHFIFFSKRKQRIKILEDKIERIKTDLLLSEQMREEIKRELVRAQNELRNIQWKMEGVRNNTYIPQGTIEAVKYAMKKSRPDNGGNADDFVRFKKVYEELTRK